MSHLHSILRNPFAAMTLIACASTGCVDSAEPESATDQAVATISAKQVVLNEFGSSKFPARSKVRLVHTRSGDVLSNEGTAWKATEPGIWESTDQPSAGRIIIGAEGHRRAIARAESDLAALHQRAALHGSDGPAVATAIQQQEAQLESLKDAARAIPLHSTDPGDPINPLVEPSCTVDFFNVPSSPFLGFSGVIGAAQVSCTGACVAVTIQSAACTDLFPGCVVGTASNVVCSTPWLAGVGAQGTAGAGCAAGSSVSPFGLTFASALPCG